MVLATRHILSLGVLIFTAGCGGHRSEASAGLSPAAAIGEKIFSDNSLSASGVQSCATCHNPANAHAPVNNLPVQLGGFNLIQKGFRATPSLNYLDLTPTFGFDANGNPVGGIDLDGRAATLAAQAPVPLLTSFEMANGSAADVVAKVKRASYAQEFQLAFGADSFSETQQAFQNITFALQQYQLESNEFHPYNSRYDQYLSGSVTLTTSELNGMHIFNDPARGNCLQCHPSAANTNGRAPLFTTFGYANLGVPRNAAIPDNANSQYFDLGLCGPVRKDLSSEHNLCGQFKVPSLRNVATRKVFFHNGFFNDLTMAVTFLVQRDTNPSAWYPTLGGVVQRFNDMPASMAGNVDTWDAPFNKQVGMAPALSTAEISDLVAFLNTLTDAPQISP